MEKWKLIRSSQVFKSKWLNIFSNDYILPNGKESKEYLHVQRNDYVLIVAVDYKNKKVLVENTYRRGVDDFVYEFPAGWIDENESVESAAIRELEEETGYSGKVLSVNELYAQPGFCSMKAFVCLVELNIDNIKPINLTHDEFIVSEMISFSEVKQMIKSGKIKDMGFLSGISITGIFDQD